MVANTFAMLLFLLMSISGGASNNDLLDIIPTDAYWKAKDVTVSVEQLTADVNANVAKPAAGDPAKLVKDLESLSKREAARKQLEAMGPAALDALKTEANADDPEAAQMARDLIKNVTGSTKAGDIRRLMAIRTLGERKEKSATALLKSLTDSKELFVADYANRALDQIDGKPTKVVDHHADLAADLAMLPSATGTVMQTTGLGQSGMNLETFVTLTTNIKAAGAAINPAEKQAAMDEMVKQLLTYAEQVGNVRADGMTFAISSGIGANNNEWFAASFHGTFDHKALADFVNTLNGSRNPIEVRGDAQLLSLGREAIVLFPSDHQLVFAVANPANTPVKTILDPMLDAITGVRPGTLAENKELAALVKATDKSGPVWAAMIPTVGMKGEAMLRPFETLTLSSKDDGKNITLSVRGTGTEDASGAVGEFNNMRDRFLNDLKEPVAQMKELQPIVDALQTAKAETDDKTHTTTATAILPRDAGKLLMLGVFSTMGVVRTAPARPMPPGVIINDLP